MPSINLRLSDEEHDALRKWAFDSRRSLQKEIVWRLFSSGAASSTTRMKEPRADGALRSDEGSAAPDSSPVVADAQPRDIPARTVEFPGERTRGGPDPKPGQKL